MIGGAVIWRQIAGALVGLVPGYGIVPKTAVAFGGTYVVGLAATRWYETGLLTEAERKRIVAEASAKARDVATAMVEQARDAGGKAGAQARGAAQRLREGRRKLVRRKPRGVTEAAGEVPRAGMRVEEHA